MPHPIHLAALGIRALCTSSSIDITAVSLECSGILLWIWDVGQVRHHTALTRAL